MEVFSFPSIKKVLSFHFIKRLLGVHILAPRGFTWIEVPYQRTNQMGLGWFCGWLELAMNCNIGTSQYCKFFLRRMLFHVKETFYNTSLYYKCCKELYKNLLRGRRKLIKNITKLKSLLVCIFKRANFGNYWFELKYYFCFIVQRKAVGYIIMFQYLFFLKLIRVKPRGTPST